MDEWEKTVSLNFGVNASPATRVQVPTWPDMFGFSTIFHDKKMLWLHKISISFKLFH